LTIEQRRYVQIEPPILEAHPWLYVYVPDIDGHFIGPGYSDFQIWIIEGVYGNAFSQRRGAVNSADFERIRKSLNVKAESVTVRYDPVSGGVRRDPKRIPFGKDSLIVDVQAVTIRWFAPDFVTVRVCR
jgi:hypothetical protein